MIDHTVFEFTKGHYGMRVKCHTDHGWNEGLGCDGRVGWEDEVALNEDDAALFRIRNIENNEAISVCGMKHWRGMIFSAVMLSDTNTSFSVDEERDRIVVRVYGKNGKPGKTAVDYTPEEAPPVK